MKTAIRYPGGAMIQKTCIASSACSERSLAIFGYGFSINCCKTDNCNSSNNVKYGIFSIISLFLLPFILNNFYV